MTVINKRDRQSELDAEAAVNPRTFLPILRERGERGTGCQWRTCPATTSWNHATILDREAGAGHVPGALEFRCGSVSPACALNP